MSQDPLQSSFPATEGEPGATLWQELAQQPSAAAGTSSGSPSAARYCAVCWADLPTNADECPDCGTSVADMQAQAEARARADREWVPPRRKIAVADAPPPPEPEPVPVTAEGWPAAAAAPIDTVEDRHVPAAPAKKGKEPKPAKPPKVKAARPAAAPRSAPELKLGPGQQALLIAVAVVGLLILSALLGLGAARYFFGR